MTTADYSALPIISDTRDADERADIFRTAPASTALGTQIAPTLSGSRMYVMLWSNDITRDTTANVPSVATPESLAGLLPSMPRAQQDQLIIEHGHLVDQMLERPLNVDQQRRYELLEWILDQADHATFAQSDRRLAALTQEREALAAEVATLVGSIASMTTTSRARRR